MNKKLFYLIIFISAVSTCAGAFYQVFMSDTALRFLSGQLEDILQTSELTSVFNKILNAELSLLFILAASFVPIFIPAVFIIPAIKGFSYGFSSAMLISISGFKGIFQAFATLLPFALIQIGIFSFAGCLAFSMSSFQNGKSARKMKTERFLKLCLILSAVLFISCILETFLQVLIL